MKDDVTRIIAEANFLEEGLHYLHERQRWLTDIEIKTFKQRLQNIRSSARRLDEKEEEKEN